MANTIDCFEQNVSVEANSFSSNALNNELLSMQTWRAHLPITGLRGHAIGEIVDLFDYTGTQHRCGKGEEHLSPIQFDPSLFPPNKDGMKSLTTHLKVIALQHGSNLINRNQPCVLNCYRCHLYDSTKSSRAGDPLIDDFDSDGVKLGIRQHIMHNSRKKNRTSGREKNRGTKTVLPLHPCMLCKVRISLRIHKDQYIFMLTGFGNSQHIFHTKPRDGSMILYARHLSDSTKTVVRSCGSATIGTPSTRYVTFEQTNDFISASTARTLKLQSVSNCRSPVGSNANELINWLREMALDNTSRMGYCVLSHCKNGSSSLMSYHRNPKGRPSKSTARRTVSQINELMTYEDVVSGTFETLHHPLSGSVSDGNVNHGIPTDGDGARKDSPSPVVGTTKNDPSSDDDPSVDYEGETGDLCQMSELSREVLLDKNITALKIMLGAAWIDEHGWKMFHRFPEVAFFDTTFKTNNEGRPLFLMVGRDSEGKGFVVLRILMPNETKAFFMWIFLRVMVLLLSKTTLSRTNLLLSDGDAQEYTSLDDSISNHVMPNAIRNRCGFHLVTKSWDRDIGDPSKMNEPLYATKCCAMIRHWVFSWMNGRSAYTKMEYDLSKDLLFQVLETDNLLKQSIGCHFLDRIKKWLREKIFPNERHFVFYKRRYHRSFEEYVTNVVEGMNYGAKKSDFSAKPNMTMKLSAQKMHRHSSIKKIERDHGLSCSLSSYPLYVSNDGPHDIYCLGRQVNLARHLLIEQYKGMTLSQ